MKETWQQIASAEPQLSPPSRCSTGPRWGCALMAMVLALVTGCTGWPRRDALVRREGPTFVSARDIKEIHVAWNDAAFEAAGATIARGFVARVYLFDSQQSSPMAADGDFVFYAWKESPEGLDPSVQPDRVWKFTSSEARSRLKRDAIGWGYSFWLPWDNAAEEPAKCTLRAAFIPGDGKLLLSEPSIVTLPGKAKPSKRTMSALRALSEPDDPVHASPPVAAAGPVSLGPSQRVEPLEAEQN